MRKNGKTMETYQQFIDYVFNSNAEQFVIFNGKESKTLCTVESANKEIEKLKEKLEELKKDYSNVVAECKKLKHKNKAITAIKRYIKDNEEEFGYLLDNEKTILRIIGE